MDCASVSVWARDDNVSEVKFVYLSQGNLPARWAHTVQTVKMSEALARRLRAGGNSFELVAQVHPRTRLGELFGRGIDFVEWYGVCRDFPLRRLVSRRSPAGPVFEHVFDADFAQRAVDYARRRSVDAVYTRCHHAAAGCHRAGLRFVFETHTETGDEFVRRSRSFLGSPYLAGVVTISDLLAERYVAAGLDPGRVHVLPDAVDPGPFEELSREEARDRLGLPREDFLAVYCGHLYAHRGIEEILVSAGLLPDVKFALVGGKPRDVERRRSEAVTLRNVRLTGHVPHRDVPAWLRAADLLLMPYGSGLKSAETASPLKLFESMAAERPIVGSDLPMMHKHLTDGENALLIPPDDGAALADAVAALRDDPPLRTRLAAAARWEVAGMTWDARAGRALEMLFPAHQPHQPAEVIL